jgi:hypothetical protein
MFVRTKTVWKLVDGSKPGTAYFNLQPGRHELERIPNPRIKNGVPWLVLKGTKIGWAECAWKQWKNNEPYEDPDNPGVTLFTDWKEFEIVIEE